MSITDTNRSPPVIWFLCIGMIAAIKLPTCCGQKPPELGYVFPPAIRAGEATVVQLGGYELTPDLQFFLHDVRLRLTTDGVLSEFFVPEPPYWFGEKGMSPALPLPREIAATITVAEDVRPGIYRWQVANANGTSSSAAFYVSDIDETVEQRIRDRPQLLEKLPVGVSGRLSKIAEVDRYEFVATHSGAITIQLHARRIGSDFHAAIEIRDEQGNLVADAADTEGNDIALTFDVIASKRYGVVIHDIDFRGHRSFVYRMSITPGARLLTSIPAAVAAGSTSEMTFVGFGLTTGRAKLETVTDSVSVESTNATSHRFESAIAAARWAPREISISDVPVIACPSDQPSDQPGDSPTLPVPCAVTAIMNPTGEASYRFMAVKGQTWSISASSRAIGSNLDLQLVILDESAKPLMTVDDLPGTQDAALELKVPHDGVYRCVVRDLSGHEITATSTYHLALELRQPSFELTMAQNLDVPLGGQATMTINAKRFGGFADEIVIQAHGLPRGVTLAPDMKIPAKKDSFKLVFHAAADADVKAARVRLSGHATIDGKKIFQSARAVATGNLCPRDLSTQEVGFALLAVTMKPPFAIELIDKNRQRVVHCGTTYPAPFVIERDEGYNEVVTLQMASRQGRQRQGIRGPILDVSGKTPRVDYPCFMPEWLATDRTSRMVVHGMGRVKDPQGRYRFVMAPANARVTMILEGALLKLAHSAPELTVKRGQSFEIPVNISRSVKLLTDVDVELLVPPELGDLLWSHPLTLDAKTSEGRLQIETRSGDRLSGRWTLVLQAKTLDDANWPVLSQTEIEIEFH